MQVQLLSLPLTRLACGVLIRFEPDEGVTLVGVRLT